jgi:hypothetical protein
MEFVFGGESDTGIGTAGDYIISSYSTEYILNGNDRGLHTKHTALALAL